MNENHLSFSQINMFLRCSQSWYYRYIDPGIVLPPGIALIKGKSVHSGIEYNFGQKIKSKVDLPKKDIVDKAVFEYDEQTKNAEIYITDEEAGKGKKEIIGEGLDSLVKVTELYADEAAPTIQPVSVELKQTVNIPDCRPLITVIDCIDDKKTVRDFKVTGKSKPQNEADNSLQLTLYALAYHDINGEMPEELTLDTLVTTKKPKYAVIKTKRDEMDFITAIRTIQAVEKAINAEVFLPPAEGSYVCDPKWCGYYSMCKFRNKKSF